MALTVSTIEAQSYWLMSRLQTRMGHAKGREDDSSYEADNFALFLEC